MTDTVAGVAAARDPDDADPPVAARGQRRSSTRFRIGLALIMLAGLAVRVAFVLIRQADVKLTTGDAYWYHFQARLLADGHGFLNPFEYFKNGVTVPGADHPPGFIVVLAIADRLGIDTPQGQRLLMCLVGTLTIGVVALLVRRIANGRAALIAAAMAALYPNFWINDGMLMVETIFILSVASSLLFAYRVLAEARPRRIDVLALSGCLTVAALVRPEAVLLFPTLLLVIVLARRGLTWRERFVQVALAALVPIVAFAPWVAYNHSRFDKPVIVSTGAGQTLAVGNCDLTYRGPYLGFYNIGCLIPPQITPPPAQDASVRDGQYQTIASDYIADHKGDLPRVAAARVGRMWNLYRVDQGVSLDAYIEGRAGGAPGSTRWPVQDAVWSYYGLVILALGGAVVLRRRRIALYPLLAQAVLATFVAATTFGVTRYRAGAEVSIIVLAAVAVDALIRRRWPRAVAHHVPPRDVASTTIGAP